MTGQRNIHRLLLDRHLQHVESAGKAVAAEHQAAVVDEHIVDLDRAFGDSAGAPGTK